MSRAIDLNADLGEGFGPWSMGDDAAMMSIVTSANIACGGHAGDPETMFKTLSLAKQNGVRVGAHPGYNDREGFGRRDISMRPGEIGRLVGAQIGAIMAMASLADTKISYVKIHGALGNLAARDEAVAKEIALAVRQIDPQIALLAISGTKLENAGATAKLRVYSEIFADRGYLSSGQLVPRGQDGAMIHDPKEAADRLIAFLETGRMPVTDGEPIALEAHSICVHGDSATAVEMAGEIRKRLISASVAIKPFIDL